MPSTSTCSSKYVQALLGLLLGPPRGIFLILVVVSK